MGTCQRSNCRAVTELMDFQKYNGYNQYNFGIDGRKFSNFKLVEDGERITAKSGKIWRKKMAYTQVNDVFAKMPDAFNAAAAQGLDAVFQFEITGEGGGNWNVVVKDGACQVNEGSHEAPTVTLNMSGETWVGMVNKEVNGMQAFMTGQLKATGDIMLAQRIEQLFQL